MTTHVENNLQSKELFSQCRILRKEGRDQNLIDLLATALRNRALDSRNVLHAGRMIQQLDSIISSKNTIQATILGQCTTSWLTQGLAATALGRGSNLYVTEHDYDNIIQGLDELDPSADVVILLPWISRLLGSGTRTSDARLEDEMDFWRHAWGMLAKQNAVRLIQVGYDSANLGADGYHLGTTKGGSISLVRDINRELRKQLPAGAYFVDLEHISGDFGRRQFYDHRSYYWTKNPFSDAGAVALADHLWSGIRATLTGPKKVLVVDLDNTIWGGVVGEMGTMGIELGGTPAGEAFLDFQRLIKELAAAGVLITVCSKNNPEDALEPFQKNPNMILALDDIAAFEASWEPKSKVISKLARELNVGLDSFVFFDDEPAERELIRQALPEVEVIDVPADPADYRQTLMAGLWFESLTVTDEDRQRTGQYRAETERLHARAREDSVEDYLQSLNMLAEVGQIDESSFDRVIQLIGKTNQFNLTTRRHSRETLSTLLTQPGAIGLTLRVRDKFGDYGLVSVIIALQDTFGNDRILRIDTWLMSCRVIGRSAEMFFFNALLKFAKRGHYVKILGEYIPSKKNAIVEDLYGRLGFVKQKSEVTGITQFLLNVANAVEARTFVHAANRTL